MSRAAAASDAFHAVADPTRRAILDQLRSGSAPVTEIAANFRMSRPAVSKHLRVLREAGFVEARVEAQKRVYRLRPEPLQEIDVWLAPFRHFWNSHVDALERHLDRMEEAAKKGKKQR